MDLPTSCDALADFNLSSDDGMRNGPFIGRGSYHMTTVMLVEDDSGFLNLPQSLLQDHRRRRRVRVVRRGRQPRLRPQCFGEQGT
jgi:hypothetical protein